MKKTFLIGWKDLRLAFRDRAALLLMLAAPFALTLGLGLVTGRLSGAANSGIGEIPVILVNQDSGQLGQALVNAFQSPELAELVEPTLSADPAQARGRVDADQAAAAVIIPSGFTGSIIPEAGAAPSGAVAPIELYTNPTQPTSASIVQTILDEFLNRVEIGRVSGQVVVTQLIAHGLIQVQDADQVGREIGEQQAGDSGAGAGSLRLNNVTERARRSSSIYWPSWRQAWR